MAKKSDKRQTVTIEVEIVDVSELKPDPDNANRGTERGDFMLGESLERHGAARGIVVDRNLVIPAGNKTFEKFGETGGTKVMLIPSNGETLIATRRDDWDLLDDDPENPAREYAFGDNRIGLVNGNLSAAAIVDAVDRGVNLSHLWFDDELAEIRAAVEADRDDWDEYDEPGDGEVAYRVVVDELTRAEADELAATLPDARVEQYRVAT